MRWRWRWGFRHKSSPVQPLPRPRLSLYLATITRIHCSPANKYLAIATNNTQQTAQLSGAPA
jgi:hypothetical protein